MDLNKCLKYEFILTDDYVKVPFQWELREVRVVEVLV